MINVFISHPTPYNKEQKEFLSLIENKLESHNLNPINLGKNNWDFRSPLKPIKEIMNSCKAAIIIGLERSHNYIGYEKEHSKESIEFLHKYQSTPWIHIEAGMAYQAGLPLLILKDIKLHSEGILDPKVSEFFIFEFELRKIYKELSPELNQIIDSWANHINQ